MAVKMTEIRWHARGGQGAKTAAMFLAEAVLEKGKYGQGFPEYGPERRGAPMRGYTRIAEVAYCRWVWRSITDGSPAPCQQGRSLEGG